MALDGTVVDGLAARVVGRRREVELVVAALAAGRHILVEGPPGTGKSTLLRAVADQLGRAFVFVEGNAELTPARLLGHFDPAQVLAEGYAPHVFVDGPLLTALRDGALLYVEEINRVPEETLNLLITGMSEGELHVPRLGRVAAAQGFLLVAAMNPFDAVGTARISGAIYDRVCRLAMGYQSAEEEAAIVERQAPGARAASLPPAWVAKVVALVRATRTHPDVRVGSSVRGAIDLAELAAALGEVRARPATDYRVGLDAALVALSGRIRLHESAGRSAEDVVRQLWESFFGPPPEGGEGDGGDDDGGPGLRVPGPGRYDPNQPSDRERTLEGDEARAEIERQQRRTTGRRELARHDGFDEVSPEVGVLDEAALDRALSDDADRAMALLADLAGATDVRLREVARRLAGRIMVDVARCGRPRSRGVGRLRPARADRAEGDLDLEASLEPLITARAGGALPATEELVVRAWSRRELALCLLVDRSGSMGGDRLATAAVAAAACAWRAPKDWSLLAFSDKVLVLKAQGQERAAEAVVDDLLTLRGFGPTDVSLALRTAHDHLSRSRAGHRLTVLLSDCRPTAGGEPAVAAGLLDELAIVAPADDDEDAAELAQRVGCRWVRLGGPSGVPSAFAELLDR